ncbi:hypothetical protein BDV96DRAFT_380680 [Lophiotrema nucula]|uniref:Uncharacterized protein n=1 Tax=Lophiotrema nucula TaxID=690887 RepID=A0A6A5ZIV8_9PLEO|nr:hypothetical protein BDV96DRAFT_380680 [Lophiotrema nucula]
MLHRPRTSAGSLSGCQSRRRMPSRRTCMTTAKALLPMKPNSFILQADAKDLGMLAHNSTQSPLLVLPAEIREMIFTYALGGQHIHILSEAPVVGSGTGYLPAAKRFTGLGKVSYRKNHYTRKDYMAAQSEFWNVAFPIDWQQHVDTQPTTAPLIYFYPLPTSDRPPNSLARVIKSSNRHMRLFFAACRQIYQETRLLPYALNEFSFQDPWTMLTWLANRELFQKTALNTLWFDLEWYEQSLFIFPEDKSMKFLHHTGVTNIKISSLAMKTTYDWYARRSFWRSSPRHVRGNKVLQMYEKQYIERIENLFDNNNLHIEFVE